jgi:hypothetical protein
MRLTRTKKGVLLALVALVVALFVGYCVAADRHVEQYTATVTEKLRVTYGHIYNEHKYLILTELGDGTARAFENTDSFLRGKYNSTDFYAGIKIGWTYRFTVAGYRIPFLSRYPNIVGFEEIKEEDSNHD